MSRDHTVNIRYLDGGRGALNNIDFQSSQIFISAKLGKQPKPVT